MRNSHAYLLLILLLPLLVPLAAAQQVALNQPAQISLFGMNTYFSGLERIGRDGNDGVAALVAAGRSVGVGWAREELSWGNMERNGKGRWDWGHFDRRLLQAAQAGYGIVGMLLTTPEWARVGDCEARIKRYPSAPTQNYWCPPANPQDYGDYVAATVERYDGDGFADAPGSPRVAAWQLWNEPNAWETWPGSPVEFGALMEAGYAAAHAADPSAVVASPGLYVFDGGWTDGRGHGDGLRFLDQVLAAAPGAWRAFDALAIHPYMPDVAPDQPDILPLVTYWGRLSSANEWLQSRTLRYGGPARPLWISEVGWSTCGSNEADCAVAQAAGDVENRPAALPDQLAAIGKSEQQQANYMLRSYGMALALGVQHLSYFQLEDKFDGSAKNFWEEASILRTKGQGYGPKVAYHSYGVMTHYLGGAWFESFGPLNTFNYDPKGKRNPRARYHLRFRRPDNLLVDLIWQNSGSQAITLALEPGRSPLLVTRDGSQLSPNVQGGAAQIVVGEEPMYLLQALPAALTVQPAALTLLVLTGNAPQQLQLSLGNSGSGSISWNASSDSPWLRLATSAGQGWSSALAATADFTTMPAGSYNGTITISSSAGTQQIPVRLVVADRLWHRYFPFMARTN